MGGDKKIKMFTKQNSALNNPSENKDSNQPTFTPKNEIDFKENLNEREEQIHTMKKDLNSANDSGILPNSATHSEMDSVNNPIEKNGKDKYSSPFLDKKNWKEKENLYIKENQQKTPEQGKALEKKHAPGLKKAFLIAAIIFIILALGAGGYYFWLTRINSQEDIIEKIPLPETQPESIETLPIFSLDKPNYLSLDIENANSQKIQTELKKYTGEVLKLNASGPIEFVITDAQNNPTSFQDFSKSLEITLPESVTTLLGSEFSLFLYADNGKARTGIAISTLNEEQLKINLAKEEGNLTKLFEPIYLGFQTLSEENKLFKTSLYENAEIRYFNIVPFNDELSFDYTTFNNQLIIGTSRMTLRTIIDYVKTQTGIEDKEQSLPPEETVEKTQAEDPFNREL